jgi:integrase
MYQGERCRERIKLKPTPTNLKRAERHRSAILVAIENDTFNYAHTFPKSKNLSKFAVKGEALLVNAYLEEWLEQKRPTLKASTYRDYDKTVNNILIPAFGDILLARLKRSDIRNFCADQTCSNKRIANILSPLRTALQDAFYDEIIESNPLYGWKYTKQEGPKDNQTHIDPFTKDEQVAILDAVEGQGRNLLRFAFWTGMRTSELIAIEWGDVDWIKEEIRVSRALTQASKEPESTKTTSGTRTIKLLPDALYALKEQKQFTFLKGLQVFNNPRLEQPWKGDQAIRRTLWIPVLKKAGVRYRNPYQTRHTYASMMLSAGESLPWLSSQMGHSNVLTTAKIYAHFIPDSIPDAGTKAAKIFSSVNKK